MMIMDLFKKWAFITLTAISIMSFLTVGVAFSQQSNESQLAKTNIDPSSLLEPGYDYEVFPYSNFTLNNFSFAYFEGECKDNRTDIVYILPCGSRLLARFPSDSRWLEIPAQSSDKNIRVRNDFQWIDMSVMSVDGAEKSAGLLLIIMNDGSRYVYATTYQNTYDQKIIEAALAIVIVAILL